MTFLALFRKELISYFVSPLFYVVAAVFLCLSGYYFYTDLIFFVTFQEVAAAVVPGAPAELHARVEGDHRDALQLDIEYALYFS